MREVIFLAVDRYGVKRMNKSLPSLNRGEIPVKLIISVEDDAFREPVIVKEVEITDWRQGVDIADVEFQEAVITEEEAAVIRERRLEKMREVLEQQGYTVAKNPSEES